MFSRYCICTNAVMHRHIKSLEWRLAHRQSVTQELGDAHMAACNYIKNNLSNGSNLGVVYIPDSLVPATMKNIIPGTLQENRHDFVLYHMTKHGGHPLETVNMNRGLPHILYTIS